MINCFFCVKKFIDAGRKIRIEENVIIEPHVDLNFTGNAEVKIKKGVIIRNYTEIKSEGFLSIGENTLIGRNCILSCRDKIVIGENCLIAEFVSIRDHDHKHDSVNILINQQGYNDLPIIIGDNVWLGSKVTVLKGVKIGNNTIIGASAVVTKDIPSNVIAVGVPAKVVKLR